MAVAAPLRLEGSQHGYILLPVVLVLALMAANAFVMNRESAVDARLTSDRHGIDLASCAAEAGLQHAMWQAQNSGCTGYTGLTNVSFAGGTYDVAVAPTQASPITVVATEPLPDGTVRFNPSLRNLYAEERNLLPPSCVNLDSETAIPASRDNCSCL